VGEAKRRKRQQDRARWPNSDSYYGPVDLHMLPPVPAINGTRIRALTGDDRIPETTQLLLQTYRAVVNDRVFDVGFCIGDGERFSAIGIAVIDRLMIAAPGSLLHVVPVVHEDIAWDIVLRHLRSFSGKVLLFAFSDSDIYDAGTAEIFYTDQVRLFSDNGTQHQRLTAAQRRQIRAEKAAILNRPPPPTLYSATSVEREESPWIFRFATPAGKVIRTTVWNGRRDYARDLPSDIVKWVGGDKIAIVQVESPVGVNRRSALHLTHHLSKDFDAVVHWARDTETYQSIIKSFVRLDFESVGPPELSDDWEPEITILGANGRN
jgi:hypothetical protein